MNDLIGKTLGGKYTIESELGRGGMAAVFLADQPGMRRKVAVKILPREFGYDQTFAARFRQEAEAIANLTHPHILPVHDFGEDDGWSYIVMAYLDSGSLSDLIRTEGDHIPLDRVGRIAYQIGEALDYAHRQGVIHRDLKPGNILLDRSGNAYLTDFGIARLTESTSHLTGSGVIGTPSYMAPEMSDPGGLTHKVDIYAFGVTLFQMLAGKLPFEADTPIGVIMAHATKPVPRISSFRYGVPSGLQEVLDKAMAKRPEDRYASCGDILNDLDVALKNAPLDDPPGTISMDLAAASATVPGSDPGTVALSSLDAPPTKIADGTTHSGFSPLVVGIGGAVLALLAVGVIVGLVLVRQNQESARATATAAANADAAGTAEIIATATGEIQATENARFQSTQAALENDKATQQAEGTATAGPGATATFTTDLLIQSEDWPIVIMDGFSEYNGDWEIEDFENEQFLADLIVQNDIYYWELTALFDEPLAWLQKRTSSVTLSESYRYSAQVRRTGGDDETFYGLVTQFVDEVNYVLFLVCDRGCINIAVVEQGVLSILYSNANAAINYGEWNELMVIAQGDNVYFFANDILVGDAVYGTLKAGNIGLYVEMLHGNGVNTVEFDNAELRQEP